MFLATALVYPCVLAVLCAGAGLLVDSCSAGGLPAPLLLAVGAAALIALTQLSTYAYPLAAATPYLVVLLAAGGFALGRRRARALARRLGELRGAAGLPVLAYLLALAPVLLAGRPTFSSYMTLADSAVHMLGADFLIRHGQHYVHLDLHNSYGQFINDYYNSGYPSGADTLFGGSAFVLGLPLTWAFEPFNAFMLAIATGPAWLLARRMRLARGWAMLAALTAVLPALVYAYVLFGSIKEITALAMILTLGALVVVHRRWLRGQASGAIPFALVLAAGVSSLGLAFGAWALVAVAVLAVLTLEDLRAGRQSWPSLMWLAGAGALTALIAAWPTWREASASLRVARDIASTGNSGNLSMPLRSSQVLGVWLRGSYKLAPTGAALTLTHALMALVLIAAAIGAVHLLRIRAYALAGWLAGMLLAWLAVSEAVTTWAGAKTIMLSSPAVLLLAWGGVAALLTAPSRAPLRVAGGLLALAIAVGVLASDALQYHSSNLAPTARYEELSSLDARFAGRGPTLFSDFDEYALYELRDLDIGGPDFVYPPPSLAGLAGGYGKPVELDRAPPASLRAYPLIVTRLDPSAARPPSAYRLLWQGSYYQVWGRRPGAPAALAHLALTGAAAEQCAQIGRLASSVGSRGVSIVADEVPTLVRVSLAHATHPARWGHEREGLVMSRPGLLSAAFALPRGGAWQVWVQGQLMPTVQLALDGRPLASIGGQLSGNSLVPDTVSPLGVRLAAGSHRLVVRRPGVTLAPGDGGSAVLDGIFLTPAGAGARHLLRSVPAASWRALCAGRYDWVEAVPG